MRLDGIKAKLSMRTVATLVVGAFFAAAFAIVLVLPEYQANSRSQDAIATLRAEVALQKELLPLLGALRKAEAALPENIPAAKLEPLPLAELSQLSGRIGDLAATAGLQVITISPEASSVGKHGLLSVRMRLSGPMEGVRAFLLGLGEFGPLVSVQNATTKVGSNGRELDLTCWLAVH